MHKTGIEDHYALKDGKKLRFGFTTGSCAAAAAKAAATMLCTGEKVESIDIMTPKGIALDLLIEEPSLENDFARCGVKKFSGDDPDVTDGTLVFAEVSFEPKPGIKIDGGEGVGRVTKPGLKMKIGEAAINPVPRRMIEEEVQSVLDIFGREEGARVVITIPEGAALAKRTFNPRLGIVGGISVLGTGGIVEPMSEEALIESIRTELRQKRAMGSKKVIVAPGNYGADFLKSICVIDDKDIVKCSNFIGKTIDAAVEVGFEEMLFISHIGKYIKTAGGIMNTHSREGDCRGEIMASCALLAGCSKEAAVEILGCLTTDEMLKVLKRENALEKTMKKVSEKAQFYLNNRAGEGMKICSVTFSNEIGILRMTEEAESWLQEIGG